MSGKQRHQMKHRELFLSRQVETLPATHIRGKCSVTLFNETESLHSYLSKDDMFFYCLVFDPTQKTLLADKGEIRVGSRYQTDLTSLLLPGETDPRDLLTVTTELPTATVPLETLLWTPDHGLSDRQIDQFLVVSRSVGTFARALDCSSSVKQPSLHMSAVAASRDITLFHAMDTLHKHEYDLPGALSSLVPSSGPVLCRDEMEEWSASEANLFEEALDKYGKDFNDIRHDFLPWKTFKNIVEYYYMWKTTDRYVQQKRVKAVEAESKLKQVYIPNYNKDSSAVLNNNKGIVNGSSNGTSIGSGTTATLGPGIGATATPLNIVPLALDTQHGGAPLAMQMGKACESCNVTSALQWYAWGPPHMQCRLCPACWQYWKRYGGLKVPSRFPDTADPDMPGGIPVPMGGIGSGQGKGMPGGGGGGRGSDGEDDGKMVSPSGAGGTLGHRPHRCTIPSCGKEFKLKAHLGRHYATAHGMTVRSGSPRPIMKTRTAFYLRTTPSTRVSRRLCRHLVKPRHAARAPFNPINIQAVKQEFAARVARHGPMFDLRQLLVYGQRQRGSVTQIANRLGNPGPVTPAWLLLTPRDQLPQPVRVGFPRPPKAPDGSLLYERVPNKPEAERVPLNNVHVSPSLKRRHCDDVNGIDSGAPSSGSSAHLAPSNLSTSTGPPLAKRLHKDPHPTSLSTHHQHQQQQQQQQHLLQQPNMHPHHYRSLLPTPNNPTSISEQLTMQPSPHHHLNPYPAAVTTPPTSYQQQQQQMLQPQQQQQILNVGGHHGGQQPRHIAQINGKAKVQHMRSGGGGRKQVISLMDAPDDLYFRATEASKKMRRQVSSTEMRRIARKPWRGAPKARDQLQVVVLD